MANRFEFEDLTPQVRRDLERVGAQAMTKAALIIEAQAKALTPFDTGDLLDSMTHDVVAEGRQAVARIGSTLDYAIYQEFGTGEFAENGAGRKGGWWYKTPDGKLHHTMGTKPKKMLRTSFKKNKAKVKQILSQELGINFRGR